MASSVVPLFKLWRNVSSPLFVSFGTRFDARLENATILPSWEIAG